METPTFVDVHAHAKPLSQINTVGPTSQEGSSVDELRDIEEVQARGPGLKLGKLTFPHSH